MGRQGCHHKTVMVTPSVVQVVSALNASLVAETTLYGVHAVLFALCIYSLFSNRHASLWVNVACATIMFALSTADVSLTMKLYVRDLPLISLSVANASRIEPTLAPKTYIFVANNLVADFTLMYRSYVVWNRSKYVLGGVGVLVVADTIWGFVALATPRSLSQFIPVYVATIFAINILVTALTVSRVLWVKRVAGSAMTSRQRNRYYLVVVILIESSLIYSASLLAYLVITNQLKRAIVATIAMKLVAIMPTLLVAQIGLTQRPYALDRQDTTRPRSRSRASPRTQERRMEEATSVVVLDTELMGGSISAGLAPSLFLDRTQDESMTDDRSSTLMPKRGDREHTTREEKRHEGQNDSPRPPS